MYKYILILCLCVSLSVCDLNKEEGADCEWEGVKGTCVNSRRCLTSLDKKKPPQPVCSQKDDIKIICCTDCELINDTSNVIVAPAGGDGIFWKDGRKSRDNCLQYWNDLPYECKSGGFYAGVSREYNEEMKCHNYELWGVGGATPPGTEPGAPFPHQVRLGFGEDLSSVQWLSGGSIISDHYVLTVASGTRSPQKGDVKFIAAGVKKSSDPQEKWQIYNIKRVIPHPDFKRPSAYNDIALLETVEKITFNKDVLPACLPSEELQDNEVNTYTWRDRHDGPDFTKMEDSIRSFKLTKLSTEACSEHYPASRKIRDGFNQNTQVCYGNDEYFNNTCKGFSGEAAVVDNYVTSCINTLAGLISMGKAKCNYPTPDLYTKVEAFVPWIESIVWP